MNKPAHNEGFGASGALPRVEKFRAERKFNTFALIFRVEPRLQAKPQNVSGNAGRSVAAGTLKESWKMMTYNKVKHKMNKFLKIVLIGFVFLFFSCDKNKESITLKNTESYIHNFHLSGDEEGASIKVQAKHYEMSELYRDEYMNVIYHYKPLADFVGDDFVVVETYSNKTGVGAGTTRRVKLNFTITK